MRRTLPKSFAVAAAILTVACAGTRKGGNGGPPLVGKAVELTARDLEGREVRVSPSGAPVTVVDFWATWCEPCREQLPFLQQLAEEYRGAGVEVYAIALDQDRRAIEQFLSRVPVALPVLWDRGGAELADRLQVTRLPTTLVLDQGGVVRAVHFGYDRTVGDALAGEVRRLLGR